MAHAYTRGGEELLDRKFPVLNKGFVRLVDYMGNDDRIVQAARVSYGEGTKSYRKDKGLINYLLRNDHTSPFEQVVFTFHIKLPIFIARQWIRHRTARVNEISGRYSIMEEDFYVPPGEHIARQSSDNKQGREENPVTSAEQQEIQSTIADEQSRAYHQYCCLLEKGIARELARINLPLSLYTQWYWQIDLHNLFHFLKLRTDVHAQWEIRAYGEVIFSIIKKICPLACEAFEEHILKGIYFSHQEMKFVKCLLKEDELKNIDAECLEKYDLSKREIEQLKSKLAQF